MSKISNIARGGLMALGGAMIGAALIGAAPAGAASPGGGEHPHNCFFINQWRGWKAPSPDVIYIGVNLHDVYKIQLSDGSPELQWPDAHLISLSRGGGNTVCDALDLDLSVSDGHGMRQPLIATSLTKLTPDEVAAIPPKFKPN